MINEGKGISDTIKEDVDKIYQLFLDNSYSTHNLSIGYEKIGFKDYELKFIERNNYYSNLRVDRFRNCFITIGIPTNGKEKRVKEVISHELTHLIEIVGIGKKDYSRHWNIKKSIMEFKPKTKAGEILSHSIYKTLDNEVNANIAQTYVYLNNFGIMSRSGYFNKLMEYSEWIEYNNILKLNKENIKSKVDPVEIEELNNILLKNGVKTIKTFNLDNWFNFWFKIIQRKSNIYIKNSQRIIDEVLKKYNHFEEYSTIPNDSSKIIDYTPYLKKFDDFKND
jgi:hypothetical protein